MLVHGWITEANRGAAIEVHKALGPGLLEAVYEECLAHELDVRGVRYERQVPLPVRYKGVDLELDYRLDMIVEDTVIVEPKCVDAILPIHEARLMTYLRPSGKRVGLLINFNVPMVKDGIIRRVL